MNDTRARPSRRSFCAAAAGAAAASVLARQSRAVTVKRRFIDMHTHLGQCWTHTRELTADGLLTWMDKHDIEKAVVLPAVSPEACSFPLTTDFVLAQTKAHRDRLIPFCCIDPRTSFSGKRHGLKHMLQTWIDRGVKGFGEHKVGLPIDDPRSMDLYAVCGEVKLPVLFHLDEQRNTDEPGLPGGVAAGRHSTRRPGGRTPPAPHFPQPADQRHQVFRAGPAGAF